MMRKRLQKMAVIAALLSLALAFAMVTVSCPDPTDGGGGGGGGEGEAGLSGKWVSQGTNLFVVLEFTSNQLKITSDADTATYFYTDTDGEIKTGTSSSSITEVFCSSYDITAGVLTFTGGTSANAYPTTNFYRVNTLNANQWKDGTLTSDSKGQVWYSFNVANETTYRMWWNDDGTSTSGNGLKTLDIYVSGYYSSGTSIFSNADSSWGDSYLSSGRSFTTGASQAGTVYIKVTPYITGRTGTFSIVYSTGTTMPNAAFNPPSVTRLTAKEWKDGEITSASNGMVWYSFPVTLGTAYRVWLNESGTNGNGTKTLNASVRGIYSDGTSAFATVSSAWTTAASLLATKSGTVYLRVMPGTSGDTGTFGIVYDTGTDATRPGLVFNPPNPTPLTIDVWKDGEITGGSNGIAWHSLTVTGGTPYYFWWNESGNGNGIKSLNVSVSAYSSDGTIINDFNSVVTAWATSKSYTPTASGTLYLRVAPGTSGTTGTYGIVYSATDTRPVAPFNPPNPIALATDVWANGEITSSIREVWYSFTVTSGTYRLWWNDGYSGGGDGSKTLDVKVSGFFSDGTSIFTDADTGWSAARTITATANDTVYLKVAPYSTSGSGTFGIVYSDNATTRPLVPVVLPSTATPLTAGVWTDGSLTSSIREAWYSFSVTSGIAYRVWWNESGDYGDGSKTLNVTASAWYSNGNNIFEGVTSAWYSTTESSFTPAANGTVYVKITPYSSTTATGTFAITYNADSATMPPVLINPVSPTALTVDEWANGNITTSGGQQWFSFTATAVTQYIYVIFGTLNDFYVQVYTSNGSLVVDKNMYSNTRSANGTLVEGQEYYIKVRPYSSTGSGNYQITFSAASTAPASP